MEPGILVPPATVEESPWAERLIRLMVWSIGFRIAIQLYELPGWIATWRRLTEVDKHPYPSPWKAVASVFLLFGFMRAIQRRLIPAAAILTAFDIGSLWFVRRIWFLWQRYPLPRGWDEITFLLVLPIVRIVVDVLGLSALWLRRGNAARSD